MFSREPGCPVGWQPRTHLDAEGSIGLLSPRMPGRPLSMCVGTLSVLVQVPPPSVMQVFSPIGMQTDQFRAITMLDP